MYNEGLSNASGGGSHTAPVNKAFRTAIASLPRSICFQKMTNCAVSAKKHQIEALDADVSL